MTTGEDNTRQWWTEKYGLPSTHEAFTSKSMSYWYRERLKELYHEREAVKDAMDRGGRHADYNKLAERRTELDRVLGEEKDLPQDDLIDKWERELEMGIIPDLTEGM